MAEYYDPDTYPTKWNYLQSGTFIDQYIIERELAHGGFSSVYLARQMSDQIQVAIKEYLPRKFAHRTWNNVVIANNEESKDLFLKGKVLFFEEAKVLAKLKHPNIVDVINFFQANDTVYMVMAYDYGITLDKVIKKKRLEVTEQFLVTVFNQLMTGVKAVHEHKLLHFDIKPGNILIRPDNDPLLLDFGAIQVYPITAVTRRPNVITHGFSPIEQYARAGQMGPWSDVYAIGASMRFCLDGKIPPSAPDRKTKDKLIPSTTLYRGKFPEYLLKIVDWAMEIDVNKRPQSIKELQRAFL